MTEANAVVWEHSQENPELRGMGTTLTAVALVNEDGHDVLALVNVGDSRSYRFHDGELTQITTDHSLAEEMVRSGELTTGRGGRPPPPPHPDPGSRGVVRTWPWTCGGSSRSGATGSCCAVTD